MPPRYAYWTIILDNAPTAFRARDRADLVPTLRQLLRRNPGATIKWFAKGRLWESPEEARVATNPPRERRGPDWRPGGRHEDPRARFGKQAAPGRREGKDQRKSSPTTAGGRDRGKGERRSSGGARQWPPAGAGSGEGRPRGDRPQRPSQRRGSFDGRGGSHGNREANRFEREKPSEGERRRRDNRPGDRWHPARDEGRRHETTREPKARTRGSGAPATTHTPGEPGTPPRPPAAPPGPDRPPKRGEEPPPATPDPKTIRILPEPPERAK
jgi:hypothetical protein